MQTFLIIAVFCLIPVWFLALCAVIDYCWRPDNVP